MNLGRSYLLGAPLTPRAKKIYLEARQKHAGSDDAVLRELEGILARVTDKSNGLLQVASIFSGVALFLGERGESNTDLVLTGLVLLFVACFTLASNLSVSWRTREHLYLGKPEYNAHVLDLCVGRIARFNLAMWATGLSILALGFQIALLYQLHDRIRGVVCGLLP